ncbi:nicotinamide riboside kinase 1-like, partial [Cryptotermes secundus]|uniref:nicotinamide riboside kinase 1-like n=1 Tax=Cryptotermes secundus TaxID=105785 RepID=UPI001454D297
PSFTVYIWQLCVRNTLKINMWLIVGVSHATCSGKSTLTQSLHKQLPGSFLVCEDDFFLPVDSQCSTAVNRMAWSPLYAESDKIGTVLNPGCHRAMPEDMVYLKPDGTQSMATREKDTDSTSSGTKMADGCGGKQISGVHILIIEGFLIFNDKKTGDLCHCNVGAYDPPDVPGYLDQCVWPEYEEHHDEVFKQVPLLS